MKIRYRYIGRAFRRYWWEAFIDGHRVVVNRQVDQFWGLT